MIPSLRLMHYNWNFSNHFSLNFGFFPTHFEIFFLNFSNYPQPIFANAVNCILTLTLLLLIPHVRVHILLRKKFVTFYFPHLTHCKSSHWIVTVHPFPLSHPVTPLFLKKWTIITESSLHFYKSPYYFR